MPDCLGSLGCESVMVARIHCHAYSLATDRLTELRVRRPSDACTMDNIHACTNEEIDWSPMPAILRAENWALIRVLQSTIGSGGFDIVAESTINSSHCQRWSCYDVRAITTGNAHSHSPSTQLYTDQTIICNY